MMDTHVGAVQIIDDESNPAVLIDGNEREISLGPAGNDGKPLRLIVLDGNEAEITVTQDGAGAKLIVARQQSNLGTEVRPGSIWLRSSNSGYMALLSPVGIACWSDDKKHAEVGTIGLSLRDGAHRLRASVTRAGTLTLRDKAEARRVQVRAEQADLQLFDASGSRRAWISAGGRVRLYNSAGKQTIFANGSSGNVALYDDEGQTRAWITAAGQVRLYNSAGKRTIFANGLNGNVALYDGEGQTRAWITADGRLHLYDEEGQRTILLDGMSGDILLAGGDCAENFRAVNGNGIEPGTVVVSEGGEDITACEVPYDRRAVGIVAGAGDYRPGIRLAATKPDVGQVPVALMGRVHCKVDASYGALQVGDLLTTSPTVGHAMRAGDPSRAFGAVLGKALGRLDSGRGLVPVLATLQ